MHQRTRRLTLQEAVTKAASYSFAPVDIGAGDYDQLIITLEISSAERDTADETYDFYITTQAESGAQWDIVHFPQIVADAAYAFIARPHRAASTAPFQLTTATPGVASIDSGTLATGTGQANAPKSLAAGRIRHGSWGNSIGYELVVAGTVVTGITYSISVECV